MEPNILEARYTHRQIVRKYNWIAPIYDFFGVLAESRARQLALEMARIQNGEKILEMALGTGLNFVEILKRNPRGVGRWHRCLHEDGRESQEEDLQNRAAELHPPSR